MTAFGKTVLNNKQFFFAGSDEELSGDEDDPDLLNELSEITGNENEDEAPQASESPSSPTVPVAPESAPSADQPILPTTTMDTVELIKSRIEMYKLAEKMAKESGDSTRARSRGRGVKTLESLLKQAIAGKTINPDDIPPVVSVKAPKPAAAADEQAPEVIQPTSAPESEPKAPSPPQSPAADSASPPASAGSTDSEKEQKVNALLQRQREYKMAALTAKKSGDTATALQYVKIIKIFDTVLASARNGEPIDLSDMPPPPSELSMDLLKQVGQAPQDPAPKQENTLQQSSGDEPKTTNEPPAAPAPAKVEVPPPDVPKTILEALTQRLQKYQAVEANAKAEGNDRKARQNGRIVKQYQDAIR